MNIKNSFIYLRVLRHVDYSVFAVAKEQKQYFDPVFRKSIAFSSGQQVKRSILESLCNYLNTPFAPIYFTHYLEKSGDKIKYEGEGKAEIACDPSYVDQLIGGYMLTTESDKKKSKKQEESDDNSDVELDKESKSEKSTIKRRSPLSISAMRPIHPLLNSVISEDLTFDRSNIPGAEVKVYWKKDKKSLMRLVKMN